ncbi:MAG TPA: helicase C-terminal domain-containing protein [Candidatus Izemoplasmatales bacterium]|nr:helicase C-terminal domain-containing protein [Candidatus Izemoplasmatales bacterium]
MKTMQISVRDLVELIYGSGSIINLKNLKKRADEGTMIHQFWQEKYLESDRKEVVVQETFQTESFIINISGRIDGLLIRDEETIVEEIKSTHIDLDQLDENTTPAHLAQARIYAYILAKAKALDGMGVWLTYIDVQTRNVKQLKNHYSINDLKSFYEETIEAYIRWQNILSGHEDERLTSIEGLSFPFEKYRFNQRRMMAVIYRNIIAKDVAYIEAPTGLGKTVAAIFSALKAIHQPRQKIFYLTAKNDGKRTALETIVLLEEKGLKAKTVEITAKDSICFLEKRDCDPKVCPFANGYYSKVFKAIEDIFMNASIFSRPIIEQYARKHVVCPFELSLDLSNYSDIVICDYNYVFDPIVHLIRYFEENAYQPIVLVDEAHNLVSRSRDMYSATLSKQAFEDFLEIAHMLKPNPSYQVEGILKVFASAEKALEKVDFVRQYEINDDLIYKLKTLLVKFDDILSNEKLTFGKDDIQDIYFMANRFIKMSDFYNEEFVYLLEKNQTDISISIKCLNASGFINALIDTALESIVFFSATLKPVDYYKNLLTANNGGFNRFSSAFKQTNLLVLAVDNVSTRYHDRKDSIERIIDTLKAMIAPKKGNYIVYFPSYYYMKQVQIRAFETIENVHFITQTRDMSGQERNDMMKQFSEDTKETQVFMFVMGGIFGESIDLVGDLLSGVLIVGVGLPGLSHYNNVLKSHYDLSFRQGFDYAYTYPGLNKVIQAVGRVIRNEEDKGVAILLDDRFTMRKYIRLYPNAWSHLEVCNAPEDIEDMVGSFWASE